MVGYFSKKTEYMRFPQKHLDIQESDLCINIWHMICIENDFKENTKSDYLWDEVIGHFSISDQISRSVMSDSLRPHEAQHARPPCPSPTPGVHWDSRPSGHLAIPSSVVPFSSCPQFLPASESFPMSQLFVWGGQITGVSALASFLPKNTQGWSPL